MRRIEECRVEGRDKLDLSSLSLESIPNEIKELKRLVDLNIRGDNIKDVDSIIGLTSIEGLDVSGNKIKNLASFYTLKHLVRLNAQGNFQYDSIEPLSGLTNIEELFLGSSCLRDISPVKNMTRLNSFTFL